MDHYKTLGLSRDATKEEVKEAYRRSAFKFHPDRHSQSTKDVRDGASLKFKQASEAYEVLIDDRKRAGYDLECRRGGWTRGSHSSYSATGYGGRGYDHGYGGSTTYRRPPPPPPEGRWGFHVETWFRFVTRRGFLLNLAFGSALLGGAVVIERSAAALWKMNNPGKSFEEAMESVEKGRAKEECK